MNIVKETEAFVKERLKGDCTGHDWWHSDRVRRLALFIAKEEKANVRVVELAALLHDIADQKFHGGNSAEGSRVAKEFLLSKGASEHLANSVSAVIASCSYSSAEPPATIEAKCVADADRLETFGAIGIARCFATGAILGQPIHNDTPPRDFSSKQEYKKAQQKGDGSSFNHFYEKVLKAQIHTSAAKRIAAERKACLKRYIGQFLEEWNFTS